MTSSSPEMAILLDLVANAHRPAAASPPGNADPERLVELATHHGLGATLDQALEPDSPIRPRLRAPLALQRLRSLLATSALQEAAGLFREKGIDVLAFKGPALAMTVYGDLGARPFTDIDVLVRPAQLDDAVRLARSIGFSRTDGRDSDRPRAGKHVSLSREAVRMEIHDSLFVNRDLLDFDGLWVRSRPIALGRFTMRTLGAADTVFHASLHGTGHAFLSLKWLADLSGLVRVFPESVFQEAVERAREAGQMPVFMCGWALLDSMDATLPGPVAKALQPSDHTRDRLVASCRRLWAPDRAGSRFGLTAHRLLMLPPWERLTAVVSLLFTPTASDWDLLPWISPRVPVLFSLLRPFRIAYKYTRKHDHTLFPVYHFA